MRTTKLDRAAGLFLSVGLFALAPLAHGQTLELLHSFQGGADGQFPEYAGLVQGTNGHLYGGTTGGLWPPGAPAFDGNSGTIFELSLSGALTTLAVLDSNNSLPTGLILGRDGNFYGTTLYGGDLSLNNGSGYGTVFKMTPDGTLTTLVTFDNSNGAGPMGLVQGIDGNFYGTTGSGGDLGCSIAPSPPGCGTIFKMTPDGQLTTLVKFTNANGHYPDAPMIQGSDGNFYGMTQQGGDISINNGHGAGTVFKMTPDGALTTLLQFTSFGPLEAAVVQARDGNFYGTTFGAYTNYGTIFRLSSNGVFTTLVRFNGDNGANPWVGLVQASDGNFYGTTRDGGDYRDKKWNLGRGTVFQMTPDGTLTTLFSFAGTNGIWPEAPLIQGSDGNLYGTTYIGGDLTLGVSGSSGLGTIFRIVMPPPVPVLKVAQNAKWLVLSWCTNAARFTLQSTSALGSSAIWVDFTGSPAVIGDQYVVTDDVSATVRFYRLKK